jgi:MoaA/NifB/PqqE/SkfB family radical SAM enzyme
MLRSFLLQVLRTFLPRYRYPRMVSIFLTTRCNLRCFICRREDFKGEDLRFDDIFKLEKAIRYADTIDLTGWGECLLYPRFQDVLKYIYSLNSKDNLIQITTNGTRLSKNIADLLKGHLKLLIISLNAATEETYNRDMKHGDFKQTLSAIQDFLSGLDDRDKAKTNLHFVAHALNYREIPDFVTLASRLGVPNISIGQYLISTTDHIKYSLYWIKDDYNKVIEPAIQTAYRLNIRIDVRKFFVEKARDYQKCLSPFTECFILINGDVGPCCFCGDFRIGNVYETSFEKVWFGDMYKRLRKKRFLLVCQHCEQFIPLDDYRAHFTASFKESPEFRQLEESHTFPK